MTSKDKQSQRKDVDEWGHKFDSSHGSRRHGSTRQGKGVNDSGIKVDLSPQTKKGKVKQSNEMIQGGSGIRVNYLHE